MVGEKQCTVPGEAPGEEGSLRLRHRPEDIVITQWALEIRRQSGEQTCIIVEAQIEMKRLYKEVEKPDER